MTMRAGTSELKSSDLRNAATSGNAQTTNAATRTGMGVVLALAAVKLLVSLAVVNNYGYFRDELYYLACSEHPSWGYVDQPPLVAAITWLIRHTLGTSLFALRLLPALAGTLTVILAALLAREMRGGRIAQGIAALGTLLSTVYLGMDHLLTMNSFDVPLWMACAWVVLRIANTGNERLWLLFGAISGVTLLNKYGIGFFGVGIIVGLLLTPMRRSLARPWIWLGGALACLIILPNFLWQANRGFPFLELMGNIRHSGRDVALGPLAFIGQQLLMMNPIATPALAAGIAWFFTRRGKPYRVLGWAYIVFLAEMMVLKGKSYYLAPVYPVLFAAGGIALERWCSPAEGQLRPARSWTLAAYLCVWVIVGALIAPMFFPVLPAETYIRYSRALGLEPPKFENQPQGRLPQLYADMFGWPEMVETVARYYNSLTPDERARTAIFADNYGQAGAIDFFGPRYGLPKSIGGHQSYWFWGPRGYTGESIIVLGEDDPQSLERNCASFSQVAVLDHPNARPDENLPIYHCRGLKQPLSDFWPYTKHFS